MSVGDLPESFVICQLFIVLSEATSPKTTFQLLTLLHQKHINNLFLKTTVTDLTMSYKQKFCLHVVLHQLSVNVNKFTYLYALISNSLLYGRFITPQTANGRCFFLG